MPDAGHIRRNLHPSLEPFSNGTLKVSDLHTIYFEEAGSIGGHPVVCLHGGPGGGISADMRRFFDPKRWHMVLFDQRGCGKSVPHAEVRENTTWDLVADMEALRARLGIEKWAVFGGSWGSTLALAYAIKHPDRVSALMLRGIFLVTKAEVDWFYQAGASRVFPDAWDRYLAAIPEAEHDDLVGAYHRRLFDENRDVRILAARAWARWEGDCLSFKGPDARPGKFEEDRFVEAFARIESHYFVNKGFFEGPNWLLDHAHVLKDIPGIIVHGRYDMVTPVTTAWALKKRWPGAHLEIVPDAGHASLEPGTIDGLVRASDYFADMFDGQAQPF